jgi:hypothetical protein
MWCVDCSEATQRSHALSQVKTRIQLEPEVYNKGFIGGFRQVIAKEGAGALLTGFGPTAAGYFIQGAFKFGGYEFWKKTFIDYYGVEKASENRAAICSSSLAPGDELLTPGQTSSLLPWPSSSPTLPSAPWKRPASASSPSPPSPTASSAPSPKSSRKRASWPCTEASSRSCSSRCALAALRSTNA